jgi:hypothetical protein
MDSHVGIAINTVKHHMSMVPSLISGLHLANISSSAIHVFEGNSTQDMHNSNGDSCVQVHTDSNDNVDFNAFYILCDNRSLLHSFKSWFYLHASSAIQSPSIFKRFYTRLPRNHSAMLCPIWNSNYGIYTSADIERSCEMLQSIRNTNHTSSYEMKMVAYRAEDSIFKTLGVTSSLLKPSSNRHCHISTKTYKRYNGTNRHEWVYPDAGLCKYKSVNNHLHGYSYRTISQRRLAQSSISL